MVIIVDWRNSRIPAFNLIRRMSELATATQQNKAQFYTPYIASVRRFSPVRLIKRSGTSLIDVSSVYQLDPEWPSPHLRQTHFSSTWKIYQTSSPVHNGFSGLNQNRVCYETVNLCKRNTSHFDAIKNDKANLKVQVDWWTECTEGSISTSLLAGHSVLLTSASACQHPFPKMRIVILAALFACACK